MTDQDIRIVSTKLSLEERNHLLFIIADHHVLVLACCSEFLEKKSARYARVSVGLQLHLVILTKEETNGVDVEFIDSVGVEQSLQLDLRGNDSFDGNTHDSHVRRTRNVSH